MRFVVLITLFAGSAFGQDILRQQVRIIAKDARGKVSVSCALPHSALNCDLNPTAHPPMQSVFKLPLAMTVLHQVEQARFKLDQLIRFLPDDRIPPPVYSPLQTKYPAGGVDVPLRELLQASVSLSDNTASDVLLRVVGGAPVVQAYMVSLGATGFHLEDSERGLHAEVAAQYRNWFEPASAVKLLRLIADRSPLTPEHTAQLLDWMHPSVRPARIQGDLPKGVIVAHKSGTSDVDAGLAHATNDIGLISLPDGRQLAIAVFLTDSTADDATRDKVTARIARAAYNAALQER
jgi:beta-lactamase class A